MVQFKKKWFYKERLGSFVMVILLMTGENIFSQSVIDSLHPIKLSSAGVHWVRKSGETLFSATNIGDAEIENKTGNGSINNLFDLVPSMVTTSDAGTGIGYTYMRIRGIDQTRINVTVNGIALNDAESQGSWFVNLPDFGSHVDNLEVQRGVGTSNNGSAAFGASMNFSTAETPTVPFVEYTTSAGSFYTFRNAVTAGTGLIKDRFSAQAAYSNIMSRGYIDRSKAQLHSLFFSANYLLLNKKKNCDYGKLKFNVLYGNEKTGLAWNGVPSDSLKTNRTYNDCGLYYDDNGKEHYYKNETDNYQQTHYQLFYSIERKKNRTKKEGFNQYNFDFGAHLTRGIGYYEQYKDDKKFSNYGLENFIIQQDTMRITDLITRKYLDNYFYGITFNFKHTISSINKKSLKTQLWNWSLGGALNQYDGLHYGTIIWMQYAGNVPVNYHWYDGTGEKMQFNMYGTSSYQSEAWFAYVDLQYRFISYGIGGTDDNLSDLTQSYRWNFFNPKVGVNYTFGKHKRHALYLSMAVSHREPTRTDIVDAPSSQKPTPERLFDTELGYRLKLKKYAFNANGYFMFYHNQLVLTGEINDVGDAIMTNVEKSYRIGLELVSAYQPKPFFGWKVNATLSLNRIKDYSEYVDDWDNGSQRVNYLGSTDIAFSPNVVIGNTFTFTPLRNFDIAFNTKVVSKQYLDNSNRNSCIIKPYSITNVQLSYTLHTKPIPELRFFLQINNIFNSRYASNAWVYRYYYEKTEYSLIGYYPQALINVLGGITVKF